MTITKLIAFLSQVSDEQGDIPVYLVGDDGEVPITHADCVIKSEIGYMLGPRKMYYPKRLLVEARS